MILHHPFELEIEGLENGEDTLCQRVQEILEGTSAANGEIVTDLNGYLYEKIIRDVEGECLRILEERVELDIGNLQFESNSYIILETGIACPASEQ